MYKKKVAPTKCSPLWAGLIGGVMVFLLIVVVEYFFSLPSGWIEQLKQAETRPSKVQICTKEYAPVCGKDGKTCDNSCMIRAAGIAVARTGECKSPTSLDMPSSTQSGVEIVIPLPNNTPPLEAIPPTTPPVSVDSTLLTNSSGEIDLAKYQIYTNTSYGYTVALPKYAFYQGRVSPDRDGHLLAIGFSGTGVEEYAMAPVRLRYYAAKQTLDASETGKIISLEKGIATLEYTPPLTPRIQEIIDVITASLKSIEK